jgi:phosphonoacetaldehyde hydrolase
MIEETTDEAKTGSKLPPASTTESGLPPDSKQGRITTIILDWAGTTVDFGCFAPVEAFVKAFEAFGVSPSIQETRSPMGLGKRAHIAKMLEGGRLAGLWREACGHLPSQADIDAVYARFEPLLFSVLDAHTDPIPGVLPAIGELKAQGIKIGSTTGYTKAMMDVVAPAALAKGYAPDSMVCPDETGGIGRPCPYMLWRNLEQLGAPSIKGVLKVGDTESDIAEGANAGCVTVGVIKGSSMLGLSLEEYEGKAAAELEGLHEAVRRRYLELGADHVLDSIEGLPALIRRLNEE